jgi:hypothetical protein
MFETIEFRSEITKRLDLATREIRLKGYVPDLVPILHFLATANEEFLIQEERARTDGPHRGMQAARDSLSAISMGTAGVPRRESPTPRSCPRRPKHCNELSL